MSGLDAETALEIYETMVEVRRFEERAGELYRDGEMPGFIHLSLGQEACAAGACAALRADDYVTSTHRGHGHCLAKGADPGRMMAELYAKAGGYAKGRGGSMHIADVAAGVLGANGIVGQSSPMALGAALTIQVKGLDSVALAFFGEGASGAGPTMEAMNIAALWKMPVIFFCEANRFAELSPYETHVPLKTLADRAPAFGFEGVAVDGSDAAAVYDAVKAAADKARAGGGPTLIEAKTHRWHGHYEGDPQRYLTDEQRSPQGRFDPIPHFAAVLRARFGLSDGPIEAAAQAAIDRIEAAIVFARGLQSPSPSSLLEDVYA